MKQEDEKVWRKQREKSKSIELASRRREKESARRMEMTACSGGSGTEEDRGKKTKKMEYPKNENRT